jgi:tRNA-splicing ligase RtcB
MELKRINVYTYQILKHGNMKVPTVIYASSKLLESIKRDRTLEQARNVACLPGIQKMAYVMPDGHQGYGFPIGGVAAFDLDEGIISPGGVGYDINCGVRLLKTDFMEKDVEAKRTELLAQISRSVPAGVGKGGKLRLSRKVLEEVCLKGAEWAVENGYGTRMDLERTEEYGRMKSADPSYLSKRAIDRGVPQLGTLGAGNHFLEIQKVDEIYDPEIAGVFGINSLGQILVMIHCGSRGFGHQVASDYIRAMENRFRTSGLPDRELINAPIRSEMGQQYYKSMSAAVNFAFANRQMIAHWVEVCIHRKGATRSFGPGRKEIPEVYRSVGQPVIIPGSMGTASYVLAGTRQAEQLSFGSTAHGAGRMMSRHEARRRFRGEQIKQDLAEKGIELQCTSWRGVAEEAAQAYKDVDEVVKVSHELGIGNRVVRVVPVGVMKG